jgi:translocation and assembly module TamB
MKMRSKFLIFLPTAMVLLLALAMYWLLRTESGAAFALQRVNALLDGRLSTQQASGSLTSTLALRGFEYRDDSVIVSSPEISLSLDFDLFPMAVNVTRLNSQALRIELLEGGDDEEASSMEDILQRLQLPQPLRFDAVKVESIELIDTDQSHLFAARNIELKIHWQREFKILEARLQSFNTDWDIAADLELEAPFATQATIHARSELQVAEGQTLPVDWQARFAGDLNRLSTQVQAVRPAVSVTGEFRNLLAGNGSQPGWDLQLNAPGLDWPPAGIQPGHAAVDVLPPSPLVSLHAIALSTEGTFEAFDVQVAAGLVAQINEAMVDLGAAEILGNGNSNGMSIESLRLAGQQLNLSASGQLNWQHDFSLSLQTRIERLLPGAWLSDALADWPQQHPLAGDADLALSAEQFEFTGVRLEIAGLEARVEGKGSFAFADETFNADLRWQELAWPINAAGAAAQADWYSPTGSLTLSGSLAQWNAEGDAQLRAADFPAGRVKLHANGNAEWAELVIDEGQVLGGQFSGTARYQWTEPDLWSANITANRINTAPLLPDFPAVLSGTLVASGQVATQELQLELRNLRGQLRERSFSGQGKFALQDGRATAEGLQLRSGNSRLDLDGGMGPGQTLRYAAEVEEFSELWPEASGRLKVRGAVSLDAAAPRLDIDLEADNLHFGESHITSIRTRTDPDGQTVIELPSATLAGREWQGLELRFDGNPALATLQVQGQLDQTLFQAGLRGRLVAAAAAPDGSASSNRVSGWSGLLESLRLEQPGEGLLELQQPAALSLSATAVSLDQACLLGSRDGRICMLGQWNVHGRSSLAAEVQNVSLDIVRLFADMDWTFTHRINGRLDWQKPGGQAGSAEAEFHLTAGDFIFDEENAGFRTGPGVFAFQVSEGNLHSGKLAIPIPDSGEINMDFNLTELELGNQAQVQAVLQADLRNLGPLQLLVPYLDVVNGELNADVRVAGTLAQPQFTGHATLVRGRVEKQSIGLVLSDIQLAGAVYQYDHVELNGSFRAGDGRGQLRADLQFADFLHPRFTLRLSGEQLQLVDVPDLSLLANPDLDVQWQPGELLLNGRIEVPRAKLSPRYLPASSVAESPDLIIVSDQPEAEADMAAARATPEAPVRITGQVEVELGNDVTLTLDKATANISGKTNFIWNNELLPIGDGGFRISGEILAYGQLLTISEGRVNFPRSPADNPHLNIKAEREIFGNTQVKRAGVRVSGTLKRLTLEPYTDPMTTRERALAMLLTGSDFDYEQGVGAVEVGMYIAPKLFISYGIGLFEDQNVISARYDLGKGFGVKATSGQRETGVDISYTIEK